MLVSSRGISRTLISAPISVVMYAHCAEILVKEGAVLRAGESVAKVGSTGNSTGNHLHVEALVDNVAYDPLYIVPDLY